MGEIKLKIDIDKLNILEEGFKYMRETGRDFQSILSQLYNNKEEGLKYMEENRRDIDSFMQIEEDIEKAHEYAEEHGVDYETVLNKTMNPRSIEYFRKKGFLKEGY